MKRRLLAKYEKFLSELRDDLIIVVSVYGKDWHLTAQQMIDKIDEFERQVSGD